MAAKKRKIVIALYQYSVIMKGIENRLENAGFEVITVEKNLSEVENYTDDAALFILYLPGDITEQPKKINELSYYCSVIKWSGRNMIVIGEERFHAFLVKAIPQMGEFVWLDRPVDMEELIPTVEKAISFDVLSDAKKRILLVDDDPLYAQMVREWIKGTYQVDIVTAGMQAIKFLVKHQVDLILLDYEMPVVDGPQVFQMLRQDPTTKKIPVVFLTGVGTREGVSRVMELKPDGYVLKSTTRDNLLKTIANIVG